MPTHNPAPVLENDTHKLLWDFDIQTDHLLSTRRPDCIIIIIIMSCHLQLLTPSCNFSLSFMVSGKSSWLHPVSSHSCCMYVRAGRPAFPRPYVGVHRSTLLMSSSMLLKQCPVCLVRLTWIVLVMVGRWPYSCCLVGYCRHDLFNIALFFLSLAMCRCLFWLMRHFFLGRWICLPVSKRFRLVWKCHLFDYSTYIPFCVHWHEGQCLWRLGPNYAVVFRLGWVYLQESLCHRRSRCR